MPQFLYILTPTRAEMLTEGPTEDEQRITGEHFRYLQNLCRNGVVHLAGRTLETGADTIGLVIFQAESEETARELMENDPAVRNDVMRAEVFPYSIALANVQATGIE